MSDTKILLHSFNGRVILACYDEKGEVIVKESKVPFSDRNATANTINTLSALTGILKKFNKEENADKEVTVAIDKYSFSTATGNILIKMVRTGHTLKGQAINSKVYDIYKDLLEQIKLCYGRVMLESTEFIKKSESAMNTDDQNEWARLYMSADPVLNSDKYRNNANMANGTTGAHDEEDDLPF